MQNPASRGLGDLTEYRNVMPMRIAGTSESFFAA